MSNENQQKIQKATEVILEAMGINLNSPDFKETPKRFAKAMMEFRIKSDDEKPTITTFDMGGDRDGFVKVTGLEVRSLCGHHLFPFFGSAVVGYVPSDRKAGLSKFQRVLDFVANKPQDQEGLTEEYLNLLVKELDPQMLVVKVVCQHTCMIARGVKCHSSETTTIVNYVKSTVGEDKRKIFNTYLQNL